MDLKDIINKKNEFVKKVDDKTRIKNKYVKSLIDTILAIVLLAIFAVVVYVKIIKDDVDKCIFDMPTTQAFMDIPVAQADVDTIIQAGINTPSGLNKQPWFFCVVNNSSKVEKTIVNDMKNFLAQQGKNMPATKAQVWDAPMIIHVYCEKDGVFDAGLAVEQMNIAANKLGYGTKIFGSPAMILKGEKADEYKQMLKVPSRFEYVTTLAIGKVDKQKNKAIFDAASGATPRKAINEVVSFPGRGF